MKRCGDCYLYSICEFVKNAKLGLPDDVIKNTVACADYLPQ